MVKSCYLFVAHSILDIWQVSEHTSRRDPVIAVPNFKGVKYCILERFHRTFHWVANAPFLIWLNSYFLIILNCRTSTIKISCFEMNGNLVQMFSLFFFKCLNCGFSFPHKLKRYLVLNPPKTTLNTFSESNSGVPV